MTRSTIGAVTAIVISLALHGASPAVENSQFCKPKNAETALAYVTESRKIHQAWIEYMNRNGLVDAPTGSVAWHSMWVERYSVVLEVLGAKAAKRAACSNG